MGKFTLSESERNRIRKLYEDKSMDLGGFNLKMDYMGQRYTVDIDNPTGRVVSYQSDHDPISQDKIQELVDKLIRLNMITLDTSPYGTTHVNILIWDIGADDEELYIETYHNSEDEDDMDFDENNSTMNYLEFLHKE